METGTSLGFFQLKESGTDNFIMKPNYEVSVMMTITMSTMSPMGIIRFVLISYATGWEEMNVPPIKAADNSATS